MNPLFIKLKLLEGTPIYVNINYIIDITVNDENETVVDVAKMPDEVMTLCVTETLEKVVFKITEVKNANRLV